MRLTQLTGYQSPLPLPSPVALENVPPSGELEAAGIENPAGDLTVSGSGTGAVIIPRSHAPRMVALKIPTQNSDGSGVRHWTISTSEGTHEGVSNDVLSIGYNTRHNKQPLVVGEARLSFDIEARYRTGGREYFEVHQSYGNKSGSQVERRPYSAQYDREDIEVQCLHYFLIAPNANNAFTVATIDGGDYIFQVRGDRLVLVKGPIEVHNRFGVRIYGTAETSFAEIRLSGGADEILTLAGGNAAITMFQIGTGTDQGIIQGTDARIYLNRPAKLKSYTVATLPAGELGDTACVTDATAPTLNAVLVGGGAVACKAFHNGAAWVAG